MRNNCTIRKFLESGDAWTYIEYEDAQVFLRKSSRRIDRNSGIRACLDLSSIRRESRSGNTDYDPNAVSTGFMARFMRDLEREASQHGLDIYVEKVINGWLPEWLEQRGYLQVGDPSPPNFHMAAYRKQCEGAGNYAH